MALRRGLAGARVRPRFLACSDAELRGLLAHPLNLHIQRRHHGERHGPQRRQERKRWTTIVGVFPGSAAGARAAIPRGIEVLVKKAAVDPEFRCCRFAQRRGSEEHRPELSATESMMLSTVPGRPRRVHRCDQRACHAAPVFRGRVVAVMLAALGSPR